MIDAKCLQPEPGSIPAAYALPAGGVHQRSYLIGGQMRLWDGPVQDVLSPLMPGGAQARIGSFPLMTKAEADAALEAALRAFDGGFGAWPTATVEERISAVVKFTARMKEARSEVINLIMWEIGKTLSDATKEFDRTVDYILETVEAYKSLDRQSSRFVIEQGVIGQIRRAPLGVVLCMGPFNYPLNETFTTLIPALLTGNAVIFKVSRLGVLLHGPLHAAFKDSFPAGVVNTVYGDGKTVVGPLMSSGKIDVLAFIGTSRAASALKAQHPRPHRLRCVLGLGAKNPAIVLSCADISNAAKECTLGALSFNGQRCTALKMLFVESSIADAFLSALVAEVGKLKPGMPWDQGVGLTPLPEPEKPIYLKELIDDAVSKGARIINPDGGEMVGTYMHPAVLYPVRKGMRVYEEEQFGPVVPVAAFDKIEEPMAYIDESHYGQQLSIFGSDHNRIAALIDPLVNQVCRLNINSQCQRGPDAFPFTGRKDSAEGTLSISDALRVFTIRSLVAAKSTDSNREIITKIVRERKSRFLSTDFIL